MIFPVTIMAIYGSNLDSFSLPNRQHQPALGYAILYQTANPLVNQLIQLLKDLFSMAMFNKEYLKQHLQSHLPTEVEKSHMAMGNHRGLFHSHVWIAEGNPSWYVIYCKYMYINILYYDQGKVYQNIIRLVSTVECPLTRQRSVALNWALPHLPWHCKNIIQTQN